MTFSYSKWHQTVILCLCESLCLQISHCDYILRLFSLHSQTLFLILYCLNQTDRGLYFKLRPLTLRDKVQLVALCRRVMHSFDIRVIYEGVSHISTLYVSFSRLIRGPKSRHLFATEKNATECSLSVILPEKALCRLLLHCSSNRHLMTRALDTLQYHNNYISLRNEKCILK